MTRLAVFFSIAASVLLIAQRLCGDPPKAGQDATLGRAQQHRPVLLRPLPAAALRTSSSRAVR
jgi:hypothetical protein